MIFTPATFVFRPVPDVWQSALPFVMPSWPGTRIRFNIPEWFASGVRDQYRAALRLAAVAQDVQQSIQQIAAPATKPKAGTKKRAKKTSLIANAHRMADSVAEQQASAAASATQRFSAAVALPAPAHVADGSVGAADVDDVEDAELIIVAAPPAAVPAAPASAAAAAELAPTASSDHAAGRKRGRSRKTIDSAASQPRTPRRRPTTQIADDFVYGDANEDDEYQGDAQ